MDWTPRLTAARTDRDNARRDAARTRAELDALRRDAVIQRDTIAALNKSLTEARVAENHAKIEAIQAKGAAEVAHRADHILGDLIKQRLLVFLRDTGGAFDGLLVDADAHYLTFADVYSRANGGRTAGAPGRFYVERGRVDYAQLLDSAGGDAP